MARPSGFSPELSEQVLARIANGEMLSRICDEDGMPTRLQFYGWMTNRPELANGYARAREAWSDFYAEKVVAISFDDKGDFFIEDGKAVADHVRVQRARLQCDSIKWLVGKYHPRRYGETPGPMPVPAALVTKIERIIVGAPENTQAAEAPRQLTFAPTPLPADLSPEDWSLMNEVLRLVKATIPTGDDNPPAVIFDVLKDALLAHFRGPTDTKSVPQ